MKSLSLIVPAELRGAANRLACALGLDHLPGQSYSVALSASGAAPAAHYGCHAWATDVFVATLAGAIGGALPPLDLAANGLTEADVAAVLAALLYEVGDDPAVTWPAALFRAGVLRVEDEA